MSQSAQFELLNLKAKGFFFVSTDPRLNYPLGQGLVPLGIRSFQEFLSGCILRLKNAAQGKGSHPIAQIALQSGHLLLV